LFRQRWHGGAKMLIPTAGYEGIFFCIIRLLGVLSRRSLELSHQLVGTHMK
jgi:hypothetical protein